MIKVGVVGSREYDYEAIVRLVVGAIPITFWPEKVTIVSGGAKGVDTWAIDEAEELGLPTKIFKAKWEKFGKKAGMLRNMLLIDDCDMLFIFWDGISPGTRQVISYAKLKGVKHKIIGVPPDEI